MIYAIMYDSIYSNSLQLINKNQIRTIHFANCKIALICVFVLYASENSQLNSFSKI